jgi:transposase
VIDLVSTIDDRLHFDKNNKSRKQIEGQVDELNRQIGQLKVENDFLSRKLGS